MGLIELQAIAVFHFQHWLYPFSWSCKWKCKCQCHINQVVNVNVVGLHVHPSADASGTCTLDNMGSTPGGCPGGWCATNVGAMPVTRLTNSADSTITYCHSGP